MNEEKSIEKNAVELTDEKSTIKEPEGPGNLMYLGPSLMGIIKHSTVFHNGILPDKVQKCCDDYPPMKRLFVPLSGVPAAVKELGKEQSVLGTICSQVLKKFSGGKKDGI